MKTRFGYLLGIAASCVLFAGPVQASRIAIDSKKNPDGTTSPTSEYVGGYCDLTGEDCGGQALGYDVSFDGGTTKTNVATITGNGILAFGSLILEDGSPIWSMDVNGRSIGEKIYYDDAGPSLLDYQRNLISAGQNNSLDLGGYPFYQSGALNIKNGVIKADWFICYAPGAACRGDLYSLTLTPTATGFNGAFSAGRNGSYVVNGQQVAIGNSFFLPATITGLMTAVPEPASWALMIGGLGLVGGTLRRRSARPQAALA